ncbi:MAG: hypothetical protein AAGI23_14605 [Bacteroidota bacterium]
MTPIRLLLFSLSLILLSCQPKMYQFTDYDFELKGFDWDESNYKFPQFIQDSVITKYGNQYAAWDYAYIGDIKRLHETWDISASPRDSLSKGAIDTFRTYRAVKAIDYILEAAKEEQIVIINEAHHMPQHRVFTTRLLEGLQQHGFKHLGLEAYYAYNKNDSMLQVKGYPTLTSGFYTKDPQFGQMIRKAHQLGFGIFGYESEGHAGGKEREINQARNIEQFLKAHPGEKFLIHCGFAHAFEGNLGGQWEKAMAGRLAEYTGIDPLTISQTDYSERSQRAFERPQYKITDVEAPTVYLKEENQPVTVTRNDGGFDLAVFHPRTKMKDGRAQWLVYGDRKVVPFAFPNLNLEPPYLVFAYVKGEEVGHAVPLDIQFSETKAANLVLHPGEYNIVVWNEEGRAVLTEIVVK